MNSDIKKKINLPDKIVFKKKACRGSLTLEAALVIPIFLFAMFLLLSIFHLMIFHICLQGALFEEAHLLAITSYDNSIQSTNIKEEVLSLIDEKVQKKAPVHGGVGGLDFSDSNLTDDEIIELCVRYQGELPYDFAKVFDYIFMQKCVVHAFNGFELGLNRNSMDADNEEYVYVTENGTVYHRSIECRHIKLNIIETTGEEVTKLRNESGGKYKSCGFCHAKKNGTLFVTSDGDKYHNRRDCPGLKRTIKAIPLKEAVTKYPPCKDCGGNH